MIGRVTIRIVIMRIETMPIDKRTSPHRLPESRTITGAAWGQARRLEFIEFRLFWEGKINRREIVDFFGISTPQASLDLAHYIELAPQNLEYDRSAKTYRATPPLRPIFSPPEAQVFLNQLAGVAARTLPAALSFVGWAPPYDVVLYPTRSIGAGLLLRTMWAIRDLVEIEVTYQSMHHPEPTRRWIAPHAIASDGSRWHARAWCHESDQFRDFVFARIQRVHRSRPSSVCSQLDTGWHSFATVVMQPRHSLSVSQRHIVEGEFGMIGGRLEIMMREALIPYLVRRLGLNDNPNASATKPLVELVNRDELAPIFAGSHSR
jgi:hypothetical protein